MAVRDIDKKVFDFLEIHLATMIFFLLILSVAIEVFARYVLNKPLPKFFELSIYSFVWCIYLGASLAKRYNQHIRFDIFYRKFPPKIRLLVDTFFDILVCAVILVLVVPSIKYTILNYNIKASALRIPWTYLLLCFPIFLCLILIHNSRDIYLNIREFVGKGPGRKEKLPWQS
ncbi:MAG: TRAP transporter small permease [Deltaproteobacteria bacterium]|nr:TRAP transporter small permease [Deltaproteobacteria bacterium]MBW2137241.1 TRAP transporter small permease [Deltaproteobacteria bacterium]